MLDSYILKSRDETIKFSNFAKNSRIIEKFLNFSTTLFDVNRKVLRLSEIHHLT